MKRLGVLISTGVIALALVLTGCKHMTRGEAGLLAGGVAGGAAGHVLTDHPAGTVGGAVGGAYLGKKLAEE